MVELRDYQKKLLHRVEAALDADAKARVMMQLPTGGGKTEIAAQLLKRRLTNGRKAVWMTHRRELTEQTCDRLTRADVSAKVEKSWKTDEPNASAMLGGVVILMAQTLGNRAKKGNVWGRYGPDDLMVVDEAHHAPAAGWERSMDQWPGQVVGMTATPWRMSKEEGFDHLFGKLICGPQVADLQSNGYLCNAKVLSPPHEQRIRGGNPDQYGEYTPDGIELANSDRPDVMTARALNFWQEHVGDRKKTIVYAISVKHARNLKALFDEEGVRAGLVLGAPQPQAERNRAIEEFRDGDLEVLINVVVVTEGFDVPEASCIVITRPTLSLALFMQMVGRGLRSKDGGGDCLILDLADNTKEHRLPETRREWKLEARGSQPSGEAPVVWCRKCYAESYAASHHCENCGYPLGQECTRCKWRPWRRWQREDCDYPHDLVCDLCHADAHVRAHLPLSFDLIVPKKELLPDEKPAMRLDQDRRFWHLLSSETISVGFKPLMLRTPICESRRNGGACVTVPTKAICYSYGEELPVSNWKQLLFEVAEWLIRNERLPIELLPSLIYAPPNNDEGTKPKDRVRLSNGLYLQTPQGSKAVCRSVESLNIASPPHDQFYVLYEPYVDIDSLDPFEDRIKEWCEHPNPEQCKHPRKASKTPKNGLLHPQYRAVR